MNSFVVLSLLVVSVCASNDHQQTGELTAKPLNHHTTIQYISSILLRLVLRILIRRSIQLRDIDPRC